MKEQARKEAKKRWTQKNITKRERKYDENVKGVKQGGKNRKRCKKNNQRIILPKKRKSTKETLSEKRY